ncbi:hypothetical protein [Vibrio sp. D431a]|uniref:hypothetical protein n=1 Tax=Vibrio sp. D431a TaxID=2837388 RepID=UPI00255610CB|nr:hypothetical protein [Vibrio sp. D431a]MDK9789820.1 hypothetical protein [Vibrio sp. D431a]
MSYTFLTCKRSAARYKSLEEWSRSEPMIYYFAESKGWVERCIEQINKRDSKRATPVSNPSPVSTKESVGVDADKEQLIPKRIPRVRERVLADQDKSNKTAEAETKPLKEPTCTSSPEVVDTSSMSTSDLPADVREESRRKRREKALANRNHDILPIKKVQSVNPNPCRRGTKWTIESCREVYMSFASKDEWRKKHPVSYEIARHKGWIGLYERDATPLSLSYEDCLSDAMRFKTFSTWKRKSNAVYMMAKENQWLEVIEAAFGERVTLERKNFIP